MKLFLILITCFAANVLAETEREYNQIITAIENDKGPYAAELIDPIISLATIYIDTDRFEKAEESLRRAQHITHRDDGVFAMRQLEVIDLLFELNLRKGEISGAESQQQFSLFVSRRNLEKDSPDLVPALVKLASWQFETGQFRQSRNTLEEAHDIILTHFGEQDIRMVEILRLEARTRHLEGICCAEEKLEQALAIIERHPQQSDKLTEMMFALGDTYLANRKPELAHAAYLKATSHQKSLNTGSVDTAELKPVAMYRDMKRSSPQKRVFMKKRDPFALSRTVAGEKPMFYEIEESQIFVIPYEGHRYNIRTPKPYRQQTKEDPPSRMTGDPIQFELSYLQSLLSPSYTPEGKLGEIFIHLECSVMTDGKVDNIRIIASNAPTKLNQLVKRALHLSRFRPRLVDGKAVYTDHIDFVQTFLPFGDIISSRTRSE
jgi:tetratricopeptide (TPR) repeat protein